MPGCGLYSAVSGTVVCFNEHGNGASSPIKAGSNGCPSVFAVGVQCTL